ncbi:endoglucanase [Methanobrevibacter sp.]|uniref:endoglucanase n=1 Tax=Methanobrevibacter sp. TaxID=66852 RepID=UPI002E7A5B8F|nr:endoglucanase [Methanobrevibacter sp.]MEE0938860.1 endoglucanase [Methanobrevibacter sp.]
MSDDRDKLLKIMSSLEKDYRSGKISAEKYSYFRSKYEDKLNTIDAQAATRKIRSMQGKPADNTRKRKRSKKPTGNKKKEEQDLVQKYIINPKKGDAKYNRKEKSSMDSGTFKLLLLLILVVGFTAGVAYGIFNFDFNALSSTDSIAVVQDTAFPELNNTVVPNTTKTTTSKTNSTYSSGTSDSSSSSSVETTRDSSSSSSSSSYNQGSRSSSQSSQSSSSSSSSSQSSQSSSSSSGTEN